jgi:hypothetical protein
LVSDAVLEFAKKMGLGPEDYDLWYQEEPIWIVRSRQKLNGGTLVRRVQVSFALATDGKRLRLVFMPDLYLYDPIKKAVVKKTSPERRRAFSKEIPAPAVDDLKYKGPGYQATVTATLQEAWKAAEGLSL